MAAAGMIAYKWRPVARKLKPPSLSYDFLEHFQMPLSLRPNHAGQLAPFALQALGGSVLKLALNGRKPSRVFFCA